MGTTVGPDDASQVGPRCPTCGSLDVEERVAKGIGPGDYVCKHCGYTESREHHDWYQDAPDEGGEG